MWISNVVAKVLAFLRAGSPDEVERVAKCLGIQGWFINEDFPPVDGL
jgi:hypothetical protein